MVSCFCLGLVLAVCWRWSGGVVCDGFSVFMSRRLNRSLLELHLGGDLGGNYINCNFASYFLFSFARIIQKLNIPMIYRSLAYVVIFGYDVQ
jgi:hypothetical protein